MSKRLLYLIPGLMLFISLMLLTNHGLPPADRAIYQTAIDQQALVTAFGDYRLSDYPVRFFDGRYDHVIYQGEIRRERPHLRTLAATAVMIDGRYQLIVPTIQRMSNTLGLIGLAQTTPIDVSPSALQAAMLWHEGFHCYQLSRFDEAITAQLPDPPSDPEGFVAREIDRRDELIKQYQAAEGLLDRLIKSQDDKEIHQLGREFLKQYHARRQQLTQSAKLFESFYEMIEGTAQYVESLAYRAIAGPSAYEAYYDAPISGSDRGMAKYYRLGRKLCLALDKLQVDWSQSYHFDQSLVSVLEHVLEETK